MKQAVANPLDVAIAVNRVLPTINESMPEGTSIEVGFDSTVFIDRSIENVFITILEAAGLVILIILLFLHSFRAAIIPVVTIPVSLLTAFAIMYVAGVTINTLTLLAFVLAIGLVVDDAIVMLENIYRHVEEGMKPFDAAIRGAREVGFAVIAMTMTLAAVYAPIAFTPGRTGRLFMEFAVTLAGAVVVSGFVALTLTPMMSSKLLKHSERENFFARFVEKLLKNLDSGYQRTLRQVLRLRWMVMLAALGVAGVGGLLLTQLKSELSPTEDRGASWFREIRRKGSSFAYTQRYAEQVEELLQDIPDHALGAPDSGGRRGNADELLLRASRTGANARSASRKPCRSCSRSSGPLRASRLPPPIPPRSGCAALASRCSSSSSLQPPYEELNGIANKLVEKLKDNPGLADLDTDLRLNKPEVRIEIDRARAADLGLDVTVIGRTLETLLGGRDVSTFEIGSEQYDVTVALPVADRTSTETLSRIFVRSASGEMVQLSNVVTAREAVAPRDLRRFNQLRAITIEANLSPGYTLGEAITAFNAAAQEVLPDNVVTDLTGQARELRDSSSNLALVFVLALAFIYLVLSAQFESFRDPVMIMLSVPLSMTGALAALYFTGGTLNVYSQIGLVTLIGLITKHGILIVDFANRMQEEGRTRLDAIVEGATLRLRPILMTTSAMVLGAVPLVLASGAGAESRMQIGWVIAGGMTLGTLLTLFVVPCAYAIMGRQHVGPALEETKPEIHFAKPLPKAAE